MPRGRLAGQALRVPQPGHPQLRGDLMHLALDRLQADQLIELGQRALQRGGLGIAPEPRRELGEGPFQVDRLQRHEVGRSGLLLARHHPHITCLARLLQQAPHETAVAEVVGETAAADVLHHAGQRRPGLGVKRLPALGERGPGEREQLGRGVPGEPDPDREPRVQPGIAGQEVLHLPVVAGQDDDEPVAVVLGALEQRLDRLVAEPVAVPFAVVDQAVGLIDEQHPTQRLIDQFVGLDGGGAQVLAHQVSALRLQHGRRFQQAERVVDLGDDPRDRSLARSRRAKKNEVLHGLVGLVPGLRTPARGLDRRGQLMDLVLDPGQADHRVQFGHGLIDGDRGQIPVRRRALRHAGGYLMYPGTVRFQYRPHGTRGMVGPPGAGGRDDAAGGFAGRARGGRYPGLLPAVDAAVLRSLGETPAEDHGREQPPDHPAEDGLAMSEPPGQHGGGHRPQERPGHRPAGHAVAGERSGMGDGDHREREKQQRDQPGGERRCQRRHQQDRGQPPRGDPQRGENRALLAPDRDRPVTQRQNQHQITDACWQCRC